MKTITFYSYKGGVGRSLALSNIAVRLSELGQNVCVMDFDLDAPGLRFKFKDYQFSSQIKHGLVDYIYKFSNDGILDDISKYAVSLKPSNDFFKEIAFICAGDIESKHYWDKHAQIRWQDLFYSEHGHGVDFFLDLKAQVEQKFKPDYFLIDSRTGVTEIAGITLRLLADHVVVLGINNTENIFGSKQVIKSLLNADSIFPKQPSINFVLSRASFDKHEKEKERLVVEKIREDFKSYLGLDDFDISVIHRDKKIEEEEGNLLRIDQQVSLGTISTDYWDILKTVTEGSLNLNERLLKVRRAQIEFIKYLNENDNLRKLELLDEAIQLDSTKYVYHSERGNLNFKLGNIDAAIGDHQEALKLSPSSPKLNYNVAVCYTEKKQYQLALEYLDKALEVGYAAYYCKGFIYREIGEFSLALDALNAALSLNPTQDKGFNTRADIHRLLTNYNEALSDILTAIELKPEKAIYFATLAEIYASQGKDEDFYLNLTIALSKKLSSDELSSARDVYAKYEKQEKFIALLQKYDIDPEDIKKGNYTVRNVGLT